MSLSPPPLIPLNEEIGGEVNLTFCLMSGEIVPICGKPVTIEEAERMALIEVRRRRGDFDVDLFQDRDFPKLRVELVHENGTKLEKGNSIMDDAYITIYIVEARKSPLSPPPLIRLNKEIDDDVNLTFCLTSGEIVPMRGKPGTIEEAERMALFEVRRRRGDFDGDFLFQDRGFPELRVELVHENGTKLEKGDFIMDDAYITIHIVEA
jgi:hypothetical protein